MESEGDATAGAKINHFASLKLPFKDVFSIITNKSLC